MLLEGLSMFNNFAFILFVGVVLRILVRYLRGEISDIESRQEIGFFFFFLMLVGIDYALVKIRLIKFPSHTMVFNIIRWICALSLIGICYFLFPFPEEWPFQLFFLMMFCIYLTIFLVNSDMKK